VSARSKLNAAYINGSLILAGVAGVVMQSFGVFLLALIALLIGNLLSGDIRSKRRAG
jgi:hypothetical protein